MPTDDSIIGQYTSGVFISVNGDWLDEEFSHLIWVILQLMSMKPTSSSIVGIGSAMVSIRLESDTTLDDLVEDDKLCNSRSNGPVSY